MYLNLALVTSGAHEAAVLAFGPYPGIGIVRAGALALICGALFCQFSALRDALK